jgi:hypothetical protein
LKVGGGVGIAQNAHVGGTLTVTGAGTYASTLDVAGVSTLAGNVAAGGTLAVTGAVTVSDNTGSTSTTTGSLKVGGGVGIAQNAHVGGTLTVTGAATFASTINLDGIITATGVVSSGTVTASGQALTSDRRYKSDITDLNDGRNSLAAVMKLRGVSYGWKTEEFPDHHFDNHTHFGFIAQEVEEVLPEVVGTDELGWKTLRYNGFTPLLVEAVKEQQTKIEGIEKVNMAQQKEISQLQSTNELLQSANDDLRSDLEVLKTELKDLKALLTKSIQEDLIR